MLNRVLIWLNDEIDLNVAIESAKNLEKRYNCIVDYLYIKEYPEDSQSKVIPKFGVEYLVAEKLKEHDKEIINKLELLIRNNTGKELRTVEGEIVEVLLDEMKFYDLTILGRKNHISHINKEVLKYHYKPIILLGKVPLNLDLITFANDNTIRSNKSLFSFMGLFSDLTKINSVSINIENEEDRLKEYMNVAKIIFKNKNLQGEVFNILEVESKQSGVVICGNLGHSYLYEKVTKNQGLKLIQNLESPIFIM